MPAVVKQYSLVRGRSAVMTFHAAWCLTVSVILYRYHVAPPPITSTNVLCKECLCRTADQSSFKLLNETKLLDHGQAA